MPVARPTSEELLEAVAEFLLEKVIPEVSSHTAYHCKVAANVLAIVGRELQQGATADAQGKERLQSLICADTEANSLTTLNQLLAHKIRNGEVELDDKELLAHLKASALAQISIDNPKYSHSQ